MIRQRSVLGLVVGAFMFGGALLLVFVIDAVLEDRALAMHPVSQDYNPQAEAPARSK